MSENGQIIGREQLLSFVKKTRYKDVKIDGYGVFRIQSISEARRRIIEDELRRAAEEIEEPAVSAEARLIVECVVDSNGNRMFSDTDVESVMDMDCQLTDALYAVINDHLYLTRGNIHDLAKK